MYGWKGPLWAGRDRRAGRPVAAAAHDLHRRRAPDAVFTVRIYDSSPLYEATLSAQLQPTRTANPQASGHQDHQRRKWPEPGYNIGRSHHGHDMSLRASDDSLDIIPFPSPADRIRRKPVLGGLIDQHEAAA